MTRQLLVTYRIYEQYSITLCFDDDDNATHFVVGDLKTDGIAEDSLAEVLKRRIRTGPVTEEEKRWCVDNCWGESTRLLLLLLKGAW